MKADARRLLAHGAPISAMRRAGTVPVRAA